MASASQLSRARLYGRTSISLSPTKIIVRVDILSFRSDYRGAVTWNVLFD